MANHVAANNKYADAAERAMRTLWQGFLMDAVIAVGAGLLLLLETGDVTSPMFWTGLGVLVLKSFLVSGASYMMRLKLEPKETTV